MSLLQDSALSLNNQKATRLVWRTNSVGLRADQSPCDQVSVCPGSRKTNPRHVIVETLMRREAGTSDPILCSHLLRRVDERLIDLLSSLTPSEWDLKTIVPLWRVRDVAAHLLDTILRKLSMVRDSCYVEAVSIRSPEDVITLVNRFTPANALALLRRLSVRT